MYCKQSNISSDKFLGKIRDKTALPINLPSNAQLLFAARGGTRLTTYTDHYVYAVNGVIPGDYSVLGRCKGNVETDSPAQDCDAKSGTAYVGSYLPNDYGLYDTLGNVIEYTCERYLADGANNVPYYRDYYQTLFGDDTIGNEISNPVIDPPGVPANKAVLYNGTACYRLGRGGTYNTVTTSLNLWDMSRIDNTGSSSSSYEGSAGLSTRGFRLSMTVE